MTNRRQFLGSLLAASAIPRLSWADAGNPVFVAAAKEPDGSFALFGLSRNGGDTFRVPLQARGHAAATHPFQPEVVAFARRPGTFALVINCATGVEVARLSAETGREFNGHGAFSQSGDILYTSEVVAETGEGRIGIWSQSHGYTRIGEFASGGIGPHEICRLPESDVLVVANGGIRTGAGDREKLNLDTMVPNLSYISAGGEILQQFTLPPEMHQASIRHLSVSPAGQVAFSMQWEGRIENAPALLGLHKYGDAVAKMAMPSPSIHSGMHGYSGSVAFFDHSSRVAISSPKGGRVQVFDNEGVFVYEIQRADVSGLASIDDTLFLTDGFGMFLALRDGRPVGHTRSNRAWDNHLIRV